MGAALFVLLIVFGRITWHLFYAIISITWHFIYGISQKLASEKPKKRQVKEKKHEEVKVPERKEAASLPFEQKVVFCTNIIEGAYSYKDEFLDELYEGTEHPVFSVPDCLDCSDKEYEDQFGKKWEDAWRDALALCFGIKFEAIGSGCFSGDNAR